MLPSQQLHLNEGFLAPLYVTQPTTTTQRGILNSISMLPSQHPQLNEGFLTPLVYYPANTHTSTRDS
ncbi:hypothetical protein DPMN_175239 [Dreissena polymorpha]|uniref:Uncharacterized protein n=1 Tax=Dreissena polymorpha TaxID=45954 RepID=A0A9D4IJD8_DREPO|nr:hypothetical protein DPMN_175239 [Dreissena polymorpha]